MKKILFPILLVIMLVSTILVAGCTSEQQTAIPATTLPVTSPLQEISTPGAVDTKDTSIVRITETASPLPVTTLTVTQTVQPVSTSEGNEGKDTGIIWITKTVSTTRTSVGENVVVNVTLKNDTKDTVADVKFDDPAHPSGLTGSTATGTLTELGPDAPFITTYQITADKPGKYTLGAITATFTGADGNTGKVTSDAVTITVV
ncbi:MAG: BatD family protein [Methanoregula sp.]|uniref:BatD family protein n=1 Tax=Methanoregula sp. TaxID=2052170 RepID=UPI0025F77A1E|nr:BatD family protein [Methanoregula sp.]MCK9631722.1 BatD family protein [Methanoregula sp.]